MRSSIYSYTLMLAVCIVVVSSCTKPRENGSSASTGKVKLEFINSVGGSSLNLGNQWYKNEHGDSFTVSKLNYYISNIKLNGSAGSYVERESYHLIQQNVSSSGSFDMDSVTTGQYSSITFLIGVDSLRNVSGALSGALDPVNGMFWTWNTGYIMWKFEGNAPKSTQMGGALIYHAGGFSGADNVLRTVTLVLPQPIQVTKDAENHVHINADVLLLFKSPNLIDFSVTNSVQLPGEQAKKLADNFATIFSITYSGL